MSLPISAVIITLNEEKNILRCLTSVAFCEDIVVIDSGSTDETVTIAQNMGARTLFRDWLGFGPQKQFAVEQAKYDWVLCIDADEVVSEALYHSIRKIDLKNTAFAGYLMPRRNHFLGKALKHGEGYPDLSLRLFNRQTGQWSQDSVHEKVKVNGQIEKLTGDLLHFSEETIASYLHKQNRYTSLQAQMLFDRQAPCNTSQCITSPLVRFIKLYFLRLGFLDGLPGFIHITIGCFNAFCKYSKLLELQRKSFPQQH
ncbi:benzoate transporter [Candidatus Endobugula sertula]|uniref:Benzoate transporter n=1 Tax=Candidatus Endobugula sertula TaxID=62101 RepID=A0A1D2QS03_9GAMM|nr:benzoate transporter [Candidatus Endobugula sertula]